jgi:hypothetical protein
MYLTNFYIAKINGNEVIRDHKSDMQIKIHSVDDMSFTPNNNELTLYSHNHNKQLAFETINVKTFDIALVAYALSWYVDYTEQFAMHISMDHPGFHNKFKKTLLTNARLLG